MRNILHTVVSCPRKSESKHTRGYKNERLLVWTRQNNVHMHFRPILPSTTKRQTDYKTRNVVNTDLNAIFEDRRWKFPPYPRKDRVWKTMYDLLFVLRFFVNAASHVYYCKSTFSTANSMLIRVDFQQLIVKLVMNEWNWRTVIGYHGYTMAQSTANWLIYNTHTHVDRTHSLTHSFDFSSVKPLCPCIKVNVIEMSMHGMHKSK